GKEQVVFLPRPGMEIQPYRSHAPECGSHAAGAWRGFPEFFASSSNRSAGRAAISKSNGSRLALLARWAQAIYAYPSAEFWWAWRELFSHWRQPVRSQGIAASFRLHSVPQDPDELSLGPRRVGNPGCLSGRLAGDRARRAAAAGLCHHRDYLAYLL